MRPAIVVCLLLALPGAALACWDPLELSSVAIASGNQDVSVMVVPDGSGDALTHAFTIAGARVDASIGVTLINCANGSPIVQFPAEDLWLASVDGGLVACAGGTCADGPTDANGVTTWSTAPRAGGSSQGSCQVMVSGAAFPGPGLPLHFNSPDINGDLTVNLQDVPLLAADFYGGSYRYRSDLHRDGVINLSDIARFAPTLGAGCP